MSLFDQFNALGDCGVRRDPVQVAQLKDAHAERDADLVVELELLAAGEILYEVIELGLIPQAAQDDAFGQGEIARIMFVIRRFAAEQVGGISAAVDALEYSEGDFAGGGHSFQYEVTVSSIQDASHAGEE